MDDIRKPDVVTVAVSRVDGGVTVVRVIVNEYMPDENGQKTLYKHYDVTPEYVDALIAKYVNDGHWGEGYAPVGWEFVPNDYVGEGTDRTFRNAWKHAKKKPEVDMPKAKEIHRDRLRALRKPLLEQLDVEYIRALEAKDKKKSAEVILRKQQLRDVTLHPDIENAKTVAELKAAGMDVLNET